VPQHNCTKNKIEQEPPLLLLDDDLSNKKGPFPTIIHPASYFITCRFNLEKVANHFSYRKWVSHRDSKSTDSINKQQ